MATTTAPAQAESVPSNELPNEVVQCLQNARFLHLATCTSSFPHVSLMNYTYLPSSPFTPHPSIIMTTSPSSKKTRNLASNPHVSLLVHDWVSHRPPTTNRRGSGSPPPEIARSSLASLLAGLNTREMGSISVTINGEARMVERGTEEEKWLRGRHLEENTFESDGGGGEGERSGTAYVEGEEGRVVVVGITDGRISDWKGGVRDWSLIGGDSGVGGREGEGEERGEGLVNGA